MQGKLLFLVIVLISVIGADEVNPYKLIEIDEAYYNQSIFNDVSGKFVAEKPIFMVFVREHSMSETIKEGFQLLSDHYKGEILFGWVAYGKNEKLRLAYEIESIKNTPRSFFIDKEGVAYSYFKNNGMPSLNETTEWIEDRYYKKSMTAYKAPAVLSEMKLKWAYAKKEVRAWYAANLQPKVEELLRKVNLTYLVDMDPTDFENIKYNQKTNRQIMFLVACIVWVVEFVYDMAFPGKPEEKKKKSILKKAKKTTEEDDSKKDK